MAVEHWVKSLVSKADNGWFTLRDAHGLFRSMGGDMGRNKFREALQSHLLQGSFYKEKIIKHINRKSVFWGYTLRDELCG